MGNTTQAQMVLGFSEYRAPAQRLAEKAGLPYVEVEVHRFPDGESRIRVPAELPARIVICRTLNNPNSKLLELELAAAAARERGARHLTLVAPYLCYMRQDAAFHPGEAVSQRVMGEILARRFDAIITVDPHLHRVHELKEAVPVTRAVALSASVPMADFLAGLIENPFLIGPDEESEQWVRAIAAPNQIDYAVASKQRLGDNEVSIRLPENEYAGRHIVFVDDMISTGHTIEAAAVAAAAYRPASLSVLATHALFAGDALERLRAAGITQNWTSDSVIHATNRFELSTLLADAL
jgi:ribose-phosphate pyrophosphokinase